MTTTNFRTLYLIRGLAVCATLLVGGGLSATTVEPTAAPETFTYIVVLYDRAPKDGPNDRTEPDIPAMGGKVVEKRHNRRVIRISESGVRALAAHRGVKYIQRVQTDGPLPPVPRATALAAASDATTSGVRADWTPPTWSSGNYAYDGEGNITAIGPGSDGGTDSYLYDSAGRLVNAETNHGEEHSEQYSYDSYGNLVHTARTAGPATDTPVDPATNYLVGVGYDEAGNVVSDWPNDYAYDGMNMLRAKWDGPSSTLSFYVYTADDERIGVEVGGKQRWMIRDLSGKVLREWEGGGTTWLWLEDYMHRGAALAAAERESAEGGTRHFHLDHLGTPRLITDSAGVKVALHDYFPFGVEQTDFRQEMFERGTDRPEPMKFTGHERDFNGGFDIDNRNQLDYMHARYYDPVQGRFLSVDPGGWDPHQPQTWNRYSYVYNNPLRYTDPDGRNAVAIEVGLVGLLAVGGAMIGHEYLQSPSIDDPSRTNAEVMGSQIAEGLSDLQAGLISFAEHVKGKRPSTKAKHEKGQGRRGKDRGGERADDRRRAPRKRPPGHTGPWPPPKAPQIVPVPGRDAGSPTEPTPAPVPAPKPEEKDKQKERDVISMFPWRW